jgi:hypothetical protein
MSEINYFKVLFKPPPYGQRWLAPRQPQILTRAPLTSAALISTPSPTPPKIWLPTRENPKEGGHAIGRFTRKSFWI